MGQTKAYSQLVTNITGRKKPKTALDRMTEKQLEQDIETINEGPTTITIVDNNGNENQIKIEIPEILKTYK